MTTSYGVTKWKPAKPPHHHPLHAVIKQVQWAQMSLIDDNIKTGGRMDDFNTICHKGGIKY